MHLVHPPPVLRLPRPLLRRRQQAPPLQPEDQLPGGAGHGGRVLGAQPAHGVRAGVHGDLLVRGAAGEVEVGCFFILNEIFPYQGFAADRVW